MKLDERERLNLAPREERAILDEIRNDRELIARLKITHRELEALSKCALMGTLTCKQDMLFLLREIRGATGPAIDQTSVPSESAHDDRKEEPASDLRRITVPIAPAVEPEPASLGGIVRRRLPEQFGILFWVVAAVVAVLWGGMVVISRWRNYFMTSIGTPSVSQPSAAGAWYGSLDNFNALIAGEIVFVASVALLMYLRSRRDSRRFKVRPGRRYR